MKSILDKLRGFLARRPRRLAPGSSRAQRGQYGEDLAADYCKRKLGYRVIARNWRSKRDELDIICVDAGVLVFVEVRARAAQARVGGFHSVNRHKKKILRRACQSYIKQLQHPPKHFRFDVIEISLSSAGEGTVRHYSNVPLFSKHYTYQR